MQGVLDRDPIDDDPTGAVDHDPTGAADDDPTGAVGDASAGAADDDDLLLGPAPQPRPMHGDIPIRGYNRGEPIPDLSVLPQERWREVLTPLSPYTRQLAKGTVGSMSDALAANILVGDLLVTAPAPSLAVAPAPMPRSVADPPARGSRRQVNFRLSADEHARLTQAARAFGMRPGALARLLTVRGVDRAVYEERRDR